MSKTDSVNNLPWNVWILKKVCLALFIITECIVKKKKQRGKTWSVLATAARTLFPSLCYSTFIYRALLINKRIREQRSHASYRQSVKKCWNCCSVLSPENKELWTSSWVELQLQYFGCRSLFSSETPNYYLHSILTPREIHRSRINKAPIRLYVRICYATFFPGCRQCFSTINYQVVSFYGLKVAHTEVSNP